jgi:bacillithiol synthase
MFINFSDIPTHQNLFLDYISEFENVERFYKKNFRETDSYLPFFKQLSERSRPHRDQVYRIIRDQYAGNHSASTQTRQNIEALKSEKTIAVVTGQQLGIFGGPLYTIYKSITAVKLCRYLKENFEGYNFVPVFWLEGDDHDYDEVSSVSVLNGENQFITLKYEDGIPEENNRSSMGHLTFNDNFELVLTALNGSLRDTEFKAGLMESIREIYKPGKTFLESFRELMIALFDEYGLVFFNPLDKEVRKILKPLFAKEIADFTEHATHLIERSAELEELYHAQVKVKAINLFCIEENERLLIEPTDTGEYRLKGKRKKFTRDELLGLVEVSPEKFSPNVLLRPICQDFIFPTGFYVGGPGEISYFAQVSPLYEMYGIDMPIIYPRSSATIVEKGVKNIMDKYDLGYKDIFTEEESFIQKIVAASSDIDLEKIFERSLNEILSSISTIEADLMKIDKTLIDLSSKSKQRMEESLNYLKNKAQEAQKRKYDSTIRQISKVRNVLFPAGNLQEREINWLYFADKYGSEIIQWLFSELAVNKFEHQILEL